MSKSKNFVKKTSDIAQAAESHISFGKWGWALLVGAPSSGGIIATIKSYAEGLMWYDMALIVFAVILFLAFTTFGILAFFQSYKLNQRREGEINAVNAWGKRIFENHQTCTGGTHALSDIFRGDKIRSKMIFRDCMISGPGVVAFTGCNLHNYAIHGNGMPMIIEGDAAQTLVLYTHEFFECTFENVTFSNCVMIGEGIVPTDAPHAYIGYANMPESKMEAIDEIGKENEPKSG